MNIYDKIDRTNNLPFPKCSIYKHICTYRYSLQHNTALKMTAAKTVYQTINNQRYAMYMLSSQLRI